jgi:glycosyltransferase involved in cell wall biosynthesis
MAAYNAESSVGSAVDSIQRQTFTDWELIVVDDGSWDGTLAILKEAASGDPRIRVLVHETNSGLPTSLNDALTASRGSLIARMDADDRALPERLALQVEFMDANQEVDILGGGALTMTEDGTPMGELRPREIHEELAPRIFRENPFIHPTVMARRAVLEQLRGYDTTLRRGQDYDLWLRAYRNYRLHNLQQPLIWYAQRPPRWRDAWFSSVVVARALKREGCFWRAPWLTARPHVATAWSQLRNLSSRGRHAT